MTQSGDESPLSPVELVVLACLSQKAPPGDDELEQAVGELCLPGESPARLRTATEKALVELRRRELIGAQGKQPRAPTNESSKKLTKAGAQVLAAQFGLARKPSWKQVRDSHLPALAFGLQAGSEAATRMARNQDAILAAVLSAGLGLPPCPTVASVLDTLLSEALGMSTGKKTLNDILAHVLARRAGLSATGKPAELAVQIAARSVGARQASKPAIATALGRGWLRGDVDGTIVRASYAAPSVHAARSPGHAPQARLPQIVAQQAFKVESPAPSPRDTEVLLDVVRETLPQVGADGRFGSEKVFVSAIWRSIERGRRMPDLSLDRFKRWLLTANRDGQLVLARADVVGAMNPQLVAESEIKDLNSTFHFVLDEQRDASISSRSHHVR